MSAAPKPKLLTPEEYLAIEEKAEFKSEYYQGEMFAMAGASKDKSILNENLCGEIGLRLKGTGYRTASRTQRLRVEATGLYTYPDMMILGEVREYDPRNKDTLLNPVAIFEIHTQPNGMRDFDAKLDHYLEIPSVCAIVLVYEDVRKVLVFERYPDGPWHETTFTGSDATMKLTTVPVSVPLADIYRDVEFPSPPIRVIPEA